MVKVLGYGEGWQSILDEDGSKKGGLDVLLPTRPRELASINMNFGGGGGLKFWAYLLWGSRAAFSKQNKVSQKLFHFCTIHAFHFLKCLPK
jgi:hypothetical protein